MIQISAETPTLLIMTHQKVGDFLLMTPYLQLLHRSRTNITFAVPDPLFELFQEQDLLPGAISNSQALALKEDVVVVNLSFPMLDLPFPPEHLLLSRIHFRKRQHITTSYAEALGELFPEIQNEQKPAPYLDLDPDFETLQSFGVQPFEYFTVHSGSDVPGKNWPAEKFESTVVLMLEEFPSLRCLDIVGPCDQALFEGKQKPDRLKTVQTSFRNAAHLIAGALYHVDNDSGIHHLAGVMDVPTISIWGPTGPGTWSSLTERNFAHWGGPSCAKHCNGTRIDVCPDRVCLTSIEPKHLLKSANQIVSAYLHL
ncbi:MAG: glycosyltransferase family 9 protein [Bdellovibrionota bacterium]